MHARTLCFLAGVVALQQWAALPSPWLAALLPVALVGWVRGGPLSLVAACAAGFLYALLRAQMLAPGALPAGWEGTDLYVVGEIAGLPEVQSERTRFEFEIARVEESPGLPTDIELPWRVRLNWYRDAPRLRSGEHWRLNVRLKRPRGFANPGGFDYEEWLFRRGLSATGYVRSGRNERTSPGTWSLSRLRHDLSEGIDAALGPEASLRPLVKALALGMRGEMSSGQWTVLRSTGTAHLMAISGLHVGLVAGLAFGLGALAWRLPGVSVLLVDARRIGAGAAILAALVYAALAGFSVPTQRAAVMVVALMVAVITRRPVAPATLLGRALLAVLLLDPFAVNDAGFWLSFSAVALILYGVSGRLFGRRSAAQRIWWSYGRIQCLLGLAMLPLGFRFFGEYPIVAPLANAFAVPWVSTLVVPPVLAGTLVSALLPSVGASLLDLGHLALSALWHGLESLARHVPVLPAGPALPHWQTLAALAGALVLVAPRGTPARWLGVPMMAPLFLHSPTLLPEGALRVAVLDVGQGAAVVLRTRDHTLVYDTGPSFSDRFDAGAAVVLPYLRHYGIRTIDILVLSHRHQDHVGGAESVLHGAEVGNVLTNVSAWAEGATACREGRQWDWNGVRFSILHPPAESGDTGNNGSCVIRAVAGESAVLLTGDIEEPAEGTLIDRHEVRAGLLLVPHHASATSSSPAFLEAVNPRLALASYGYRNRFALPSPQVMDRYRSRGIPVLGTVSEGAIEIDLYPDGAMSAPRRFRRERKRYWQWREEGPS